MEEKHEPISDELNLHRSIQEELNLAKELDSIQIEDEDVALSVKEEPEIVRLKEEIQKAQQTVTGLKQKNDDLSIQVQQAQITLTYLQGEYQEALKQNQIATENLNAKTPRTLWNSREYDALSKIQKESTSQVDELAKKIQATKEFHAQLLVYQKESQSEFNDATQDLTELKQTLTQSQESKGFFTGLQDKYNNLLAQSQLNQLDIEDPENELTEVENYSQEENLDPDSETVHLNERDSEISSLTESPTPSRRSSLETLQEAIQTTESDLERMISQIEQAFVRFGEENARISEDLLECDEQISELREEIELLQISLDSATKAYNNSSSFRDRNEVKVTLEHKNNLEQKLSLTQQALNQEIKKLNGLTQEQNELQSYYNSLLSQKADIQLKLEELKTQEDDLLSGKITEIDIDNLSHYSAVTTNEMDEIRAYKPSTPIISLISSFETEKPRIQEHIAYIENLIITDETLRQKLDDLYDQFDQINDKIDSQPIKIEEKSDELKGELTQILNLQKGNLQKIPPSIWYEIKRFFMNAFGISTKKQTIEASIRHYEQEIEKADVILEKFKKDIEIETIALTKQSKEIDSNINKLAELFEENNEKILEENASLETLPNKIQELKNLLARDENSVREKLIEQCKIDSSMGILRDKESPDSIAVKKSLQAFLLDPTNITLSALEKEMSQHPNFTTNRYLTQLIKDAKDLYPQIPEINRIPLEINREKVVQFKTDQINHHLQQINQLREDIAENGMNLAETQTILHEVQQNRAALRQAYKLLYIAEQRQRMANQEGNEQHKMIMNSIVTSLQQEITEMEQHIPKMKRYQTIPELAAVDYEASRATIESILEYYEITVPEEMEFTFSNIQKLIKSSDYHDQILDEINKLPEIVTQAEETVQLLEHVTNNLENIIQKSEQTIETILTDIDALAVELAKQANDPNHIKKDKMNQGLTQFNQMIDRFGEHFEKNPSKALTEFKRQLSRMDPDIQKELNQHFTQLSQHLEEVLNTSIHSPIQRVQNNLTNLIEEIKGLHQNSTSPEENKKLTQWLQSAEQLNTSFNELHEKQSKKALINLQQQLETFAPEIQQLSSYSQLSDNVNQMLSTGINKISDSLKWSDDPQLHKDNHKSLSIQYSQQRKNQDQIQNQILNLESKNQTLDQEKIQILQDTQINIQSLLEPLIIQCEKIKPVMSRDSPVRLKLKDFLNDPTQERLEQLTQAMSKDKNYIKNEKLTTLITEVAEFYPQLNEAHQAALQASPSSRSFKSFKETLNTNRPETPTPPSSPAVENSSDRRFSLGSGH